MTGLTRRNVIRTTATTAWAAPVIVAVSAAPAYAGSPDVPRVRVAALQGTRRTTTAGQTGLIDVEALMINDGAAASALSVTLQWAVLTAGSANRVVTDVRSGWVAGPESSGQVLQRTFTRAGGLGAGESDTLTFSFGSSGGAGEVSCAPPMTTPTGANSGLAGQWGEAEVINLDITSVTYNPATKLIRVNLVNNGPLPVVRHTVTVEIAPSAETFSFTAGTGNPSDGYTASPSSVATTSSTTPIRFTTTARLDAGFSTAFSFTIDHPDNGAGNILAVVTDPASVANDSRDVDYAGPLAVQR